MRRARRRARILASSSRSGVVDAGSVVAGMVVAGGMVARVVVAAWLASSDAPAGLGRAAVLVRAQSYSQVGLSRLQA